MEIIRQGVHTDNNTLPGGGRGTDTCWTWNSTNCTCYQGNVTVCDHCKIINF